MVLEEATSPTEEPTTPFSSSESPTSDLDPYSTNQPTTTSSSIIKVEQDNAEPLYVNTNNLPKPFAFLPFMEAQHARNIANGIYATCTYASKVLQRPLRQEEADAFAFHWAKSMRTASYGTPAGVSVAMIWAYRFSDYRFPLWRPMKAGSSFSPDRLGPLRGSAARAGWNFMRYNAYGAVGMVIGQLWFATYALTVHAASRALDPRLKEFTEALKQRQKEGMNRAREIREQRIGESRQTESGETFEMARQRRVAMQQRQRSRGRAGGVDDDMSPTGGSFAEDFMEGATGGDGGEDVSARVEALGRQEQQSRNQNAAYDAFASSVNSGDSESSPTITRDTSSPQSQPTQQTPRSQQQQPPPTRSSGSAWERLRQNAMSGQPANPPPTASRGSTSVSPSSRNDFSFSNSEEDRQLAKSEAQRDFDARVEREREGRDFG